MATINASRTRSRAEPLCQSGSCQVVNSTETDTTGCPRTTEGINCGAVTFGAYGACSYADGCANSGSRVRVRTEPKCTSGACTNTTSNDTDTAGCARNQDGLTCSATSYGAYSACSYADTCTNSGSRTRSVTTYACGGGSCNSAPATETDAAGCGRSTVGTSCGAPSTATGTCGYAAICDNAGSRVDQVTSYACDSAGSCVSSTAPVTVGCSRNTDGVVCSTQTCTACVCFRPDCTKYKDCTNWACAAGACNSTLDPQIICGACTPPCTPM